MGWDIKDDECYNVLKYYSGSFNSENYSDKKHAVSTLLTSPVVPRIPLRDLCIQNKEKFNRLMEEHSFVVLTEIGSMVQEYEMLASEMKKFFCSSTEEQKNVFQSKEVYWNETNTPMWYCGYEKTTVREAFRIHAGSPHRQSWPSVGMKNSWMKILRKMQRICDRALSLTIDETVIPYNQRSEEEDLSVCYAFFYPNCENSGQSWEENVFQHVDPSLYVIEPVPDVEGLEVFDQKSQSWILSEKICRPGKELILFCGKALENCTKSRIKGTLHRVSRAKDRRMCVIYEQKYQEYFD